MPVPIKLALGGVTAQRLNPVLRCKDRYGIPCTRDILFLHNPFQFVAHVLAAKPLAGADCVSDVGLVIGVVFGVLFNHGDWFSLPPVVGETLCLPSLILVVL